MVGRREVCVQRAWPWVAVVPGLRTSPHFHVCARRGLHIHAALFCVSMHESRATRRATCVLPVCVVMSGSRLGAGWERRAVFSLCDQGPTEVLFVWKTDGRDHSTATPPGQTPVRSRHHRVHRGPGTCPGSEHGSRSVGLECSGRILLRLFALGYNSPPLAVRSAQRHSQCARGPALRRARTRRTTAGAGAFALIRPARAPAASTSRR